MTPIDRARTLASHMRQQTTRDWPEHWMGILRDPTSATSVRRIAHEALKNLGVHYREPGEDDE